MHADETRRIVLEWIDAVNRGDGDAVAGAFTDEATWWVSGSRPVSTIAEGNRVAVEWKGFATSARGGEYRQGYHMAFELTDAGQIAAVREYNDTLHSHQVLFS